ncbi:MAG: NADH-quinone oxidoreductase subunit NuoH [Anaerolineales bacterium]|nr:NADH-quinone oxidoreductase subunit NuoH [Anaerolineae bacterium]PWB53528.1 MAG: NADH-quinone oxidoreductase subunit NuoH [Anaerolineales bacterium]
MTAALLIEYIIKSVLILLVMTAGFAYVTYYERKALARMQTRIGPNRAGPWGLFQPVADGIKLIFKEEFIPAKADKLLFLLAPVITVIPALIITAVVPWGPTIEVLGRQINLYLANVNVAILYLGAVASIAVYGIVLAGWSSNNKYAMMGGLRSTAQMISYELALGLSFVSVTLLAGSMSLVDIVNAQGTNGILGWIVWNLSQPLGFVLFMIAGLAETNRAPFDLPEAEHELTAGYHTEYSGMKFAMFYMAEYIKIIAISMIAATLFLGGYLGPFINQLPWLGPIYLFIKTLIVIFVFIWIRATWPRFRYDRLMAFGWKVLLPLGFLNVFIAAVVTVLRGG